MKLPGPMTIGSRSYASVFLVAGQIHSWGSGWGANLARAFGAAVLPAMFLLRSGRQEVYNILWALVFGFATLNILSLGVRRLEPNKTGLNFGEVLAILVVLLSIVLLGWEMLYVFHVLPIKLTAR